MSLTTPCPSCGTPLPEDAPAGALCPTCTDAASAQTRVFRAPVLETIGDFEVLEKLGEGGMGAVYRARQASLDRLVALKVLPDQAGLDEESVSRFQREARVAAQLNHPNLVRVYANGSAEGTHFIAMELVEGENLHQRLKRGALAMPEAVRICADVARALQCGWDTAQLIHRDIKPSNIYLSHDGAVKLGDLGIAKSLLANTTGLTQTGTMMGTPHYISPEQARADRNLDFRADIYSLGCTLFQCLTGRTPYSADDPLTLMSLHRDAPPPALLKALPNAPLPLARLVGRMLKKSRHERHASYADLIAEMENVLQLLVHGDATAGRVANAWKQHAEQPPTARPATTVASPSRSRAPLYGAVTIGVLLLGLVVWSLLPGKKPSRDEPATKSATAPVTAAEPGGANPTAEPWEDVIRKPGALALSKSVERTPEGLRFSDDGSARIVSSDNQGDAALRIVATYGGLRPTLTVRNCSGGVYTLSAKDAEVLLTRYDYASAKDTVLQRFPLPKPLQAGADYELEFRVVGQTFTARLNGGIVGTATDDTYARGRAAVRVISGSAPPAIVKSIHFLDLDAGAGSAQPGTPGTSAAAPARAPAAGSVRSTGWHYLLPTVDLDRDVVSGTWKKVAGGIELERPTAGGVLEFDYVAPPDYEFEIEFTPTSGGNNVNQHLSMAGSPFIWKMQAHGRTPPLYGLDLLDGKYCKDLSEAALTRDMVLEPGRRYVSNVKIHPGRVETSINGIAFLNWAGDPSRLSTEGQLKLRNPQHLGIGSWTRGVIFHRAAVREIPPLGQAASPAAGDAPATTDSAAKDAPFVNSLGMKFVPVPITGGPTDGKRVLFSIWETRVQDYEAFIKESGREWRMTRALSQDATHPAVNVSWSDAVAFCDWLTARERASGRIGADQSYRLPSDFEWSIAAGMKSEDSQETPAGRARRGSQYYWGDSWPPPPGIGNFAGEEADGKTDAIIAGYRDPWPDIAPIGSFPPNALGIHDLDGNIGEWVEDWHDETREHRTARGGAFTRGTEGYLRRGTRSFYKPDVIRNMLGFRVVLAPVERR